MHQLFRLMKEGHLQAYDNLGRKVVDIDSCEKGKKKSYERIEELISIREGTKLAGNVAWSGTIEKPLTKEEIKREAREKYNTQPLDTPINPDPENCVLFDFTSSEKNFIKATTFEFGEDEVLNLVKEKTLLKSEADQRPAGQAPDDFTAKEIFPCGPGTKWEDIKITLTADDTVKIKTPQGEGIFSYHQLGMSNENTRELRPTVLWAFVKILSENDGFISSKNPDYNSKFPDTAKRLNKHLKQLFGIDESIYQGHYKKMKGYKTKIFFSDRTKVVS